MAKNLKLIWGNPKLKRQNALKKAWKWLNKPHELRLPCWWITKQQKIDFLKSKIANAFGDYDFQTETVGLYPATRAESVVEEIIKRGLVDYYFDLYQLNQQQIQRIERLKKKYKIA